MANSKWEVPKSFRYGTKENSIFVTAKVTEYN